MILSRDIRSHLKPDTVYGRKGDIVTFIEFRYPVVLVMDANGKGFPVNRSFIIDDLNELTNNGELPIHREADRVEEEPDKKLRGQKGNKIYGGGGKDAAPTLF